jgi:hypothetical protein
LTSATSGHQRAFHHVGLAVELAQFLAVGDDGADAGLGEEGRDAGAAGAQLLGQRALRREVQLEFAGQVLALELLVLADVRRDHLLDLARLQQLAQAEVVDPGVVGDDREVLAAAGLDRVDQRLGMPHRPKPPTARSWPLLTTPSIAAPHWDRSCSLRSPAGRRRPRSGPDEAYDTT